MRSSQKRMHPGPNPSSKKARKGRPDPGGGGEDPAAARRREHLELERLVAAMEREERPQPASAQTLGMRRERALALWGGVGPQLRGPAHARLEARVQRVCQRALEVVAEMDQNAKEDPLRRIFFGGAQASDKSTVVNTPAPAPSAQGAQAGAGTTKAREKTAATKNKLVAPPPNVQDLQKTQREQMESAISQMASQMKEETSKIHSTLQQQTTGVLAEMEDVATDNVEQVSKVAKDVKDHVRKNWKRSIGTWTMLFTLAGAFLFCLLVIQMAPKRPDACLFFCSPETKISGPIERRTSTQTTDKNACDVDVDGSCQFEENGVSRERVGAAAAKTPAHVKERILDEELDDLENIEFPESGSVEDIMDEYMETVSSIGQIPTAGGDISYDLDDIDFPLDGQVDDVMKEYLETVEAVHGAPTESEDRDDDGPDTLESANAHVAASDARREEELVSDLFAAVLADDVDLVENYLAGKPELIKQSEDDGRTLLHVAVSNKSDRMVELLMALGADQNAMAADGETLLDISVKENGQDHPITCRLKGQVHDGEPFTATDLRAAAELNQLDAVRGYLRVQPGLVNEADENGWAPVHLATRSGNTEVVRLLLDTGADISLVTASDKKPLDIALERLGSDHPISGLLLNLSPLLEDLSINARETGLRDVEREEISTRNVGETDDRRRNSDAQTNAYDSNLSIAVLAAAAHGDVDTLNSLLETHRDLKDATDENDWNALHTAASSEQTDSVRVLLRAGCDFWSRNNAGETPFDIALSEFGDDHPITVMLNEAREADLDDIDGLMEAIESGDAPTVLSVVRAKPYFRKNEMAAVALHHAITLNQLDCVEVLLDNDWDPLWEDEGGKSALDIANERYEPGSPMLRLFKT